MRRPCWGMVTRMSDGRVRVQFIVSVGTEGWGDGVRQYTFKSWVMAPLDPRTEHYRALIERRVPEAAGVVYTTQMLVMR